MAEGDNKGCFFLIAVPITFIIITLIILLGLFFLSKGEYSKWRDNFEGNYLSTDYVSFEEDEQIQEVIDAKLLDFQESSEDVYFVEITDEEFLYLLGQQLEVTLPKYIELYRGLVISNEGEWDIYVQTEYKENLLPWVIITLSKDDIETAELYVSELKVGDYDLDEYWLEGIREDINDGLSEALLLVNENEFSGRRFENIELEEGSMIVKGSL